VIGRKYQPRPYFGKLEFFKGSIRDAPIRFASGLPIESRWIDLALGGIRVHSIPGDHQTMLEEPGAGQIAAIVDACLTKQTADRP
jgi:thioesterase domain-containing protein